MDPLTLVLLAVGLAMDAFAVSICKGMAMKTPPLRSMLVIGLWFGFFQALMPTIGFYLGGAFYDLISDFDHWIAFILLALIGINMVREGLSGEEEDSDPGVGPKLMLMLAIATSIDALAVGISLAMTEDSILCPAMTIGLMTFAISAVGVKIGSVFGDRFGSKAEIAGGTILVLIGLKLLLESFRRSGLTRTVALRQDRLSGGTCRYMRGLQLRAPRHRPPPSCGSGRGCPSSCR